VRNVLQGCGVWISVLVVISYVLASLGTYIVSITLKERQFRDVGWEASGISWTVVWGDSGRSWTMGWRNTPLSKGARCSWWCRHADYLKFSGKVVHCRRDAATLWIRWSCNKHSCNENSVGSGGLIFLKLKWGSLSFFEIITLWIRGSCCKHSWNKKSVGSGRPVFLELMWRESVVFEFVATDTSSVFVRSPYSYLDCNMGWMRTWPIREYLIRYR